MVCCESAAETAVRETEGTELGTSSVQCIGAGSGDRSPNQEVQDPIEEGGLQTQQGGPSPNCHCWALEEGP